MKKTNYQTHQNKNVYIRLIGLTRRALLSIYKHCDQHKLGSALRALGLSLFVRVKVLPSLGSALRALGLSLVWVGIAALVAVPTILNVGSAQAAPSSQLNFQARLQSNTGALIPDGNYHVEFKIYDSLASGASAQGVCSLDSSTDDCLWLETRTGANVIAVQNGYLTANLGSVTAFGSGIDWSQQLYLSINIGGNGGSPSWDGEMSPRLQITSVPYAFAAGTAENVKSTDVDSADSADVNISTGDSTTSGTTGDIIVDTGVGATANGGITLGGVNASSVSIGNSGAVLTLAGSSILLNSATLQRTATGTTSLDLVDGSDTTLALLNSGAGVANLTVDGSITVATLGSADSDAVICRNTSNQLATCNSTFLTSANAFVQNGNSFTANAVLGTNDAYSLLFETGGNTQVTIADGGATTFKNSTNSTTAFQVQNSSSGSVFNVDTTNGRVSLGTTTTTAGQLVVTSSNANPSNNYAGIVSTPTIDYTALSTNTNYAGYFNITNTSANDTSGTFTGVYARAQHTAGYDTTYLYGVDASTFSTGSGIITTNSIAINASNTLQGSGSAINATNVKGLNVEAPTLSTVSVTNSLGVDIANQGSASVANTYGIRVAAQTSSTTTNVGVAIGEAANNNNTNLLIGTTTAPSGSFSIYNNSADDNVFAGNLRVGSTSAPTVALDVTGAGTFSGLLTGSAGLTVTGGTVNLNASSNNNTNINTGTSTGTVAIGNSASTTTVLGTTTINTTGTATTGIGNSGAVLTLSGSSILLNSATLQRTAAGTTSLDLVDGANTTLALINSGAGAANLTVDGSITVATLGSADTSNYLCRNSSNQLATCTGSILSSSLTDNITDAFDLQEGTNNYININTTNGSEEIQFGNATTNPDFTFLGSGNTNIAGQLTVNGTAADQIQLVVKANASQTATTPLFQAQTSAGAEIYSIRAPDEYSVFLGYRAGYIDDGSGGQNTGVGSNALLNNVAGYYNVAVGSNALSSNDDGASNIAIGQQALNTNVSGTQNTAVGGSALINSTGNYNTALGFEAGSTTTGAENLFLGYKAGDNLTTGSYNILIGNEIDAVSATGDYQLNIGDSIYGDLQNDRIAVGTSTTSAARLTVSNSSSTDAIFVAQDNATAVLTIANGGAATFQNETDSTTAFRILQSSGAGGGALLTADTTNYLLKVAPTQFVSSGSTQSFAANGSVTGVDSYSTIAVNATVAGVTVTIPAPAAGGQVVGRVLYVAAVNGSQDFVLSLAGTSVDINMKANSTATLIWNGTGWTAAGASSSTDLQAAYDNTAATAGGAEIVLSSTGTGGLTIRNDASTPITGGLLEIQTSIGSNLFSVNNNATEYASNGGAETSSTFSSDWVAHGTGPSISRYTTTGNNIATGVASVFVDTTSTANTGVKNVLNTTLTANLKYKVSYTVRHTSSTSTFTTLDTYFSSDGTTASTACSTGDTVTYNQWTRIDCTFTPTSVSSSNAIIIRHSDAVEHDFYVDNFSVTVSADANHAVDGSVDSALGTNWQAYDADGGAGTSGVARDTTNIYDTSGSVAVTTTAGSAEGEGVRNNMAIAPSVSTQYLVTFYAKSSTSFSDIKVGFLPAGGSSLPSAAQLCADYNTQSVSTSGWTKITCVFSTPSSGISDPDLVIYQGSAAARTFYVDALSITLNTNNSSNVQVGGGQKGGPTTLFTLDRSAGAPIADNNDAYLGSMYYDTVTGRIQCYEADGWGACGAAPDNIVNLNPEYSGAVLNGSGVGTMTADFCSNDTALSVNDTLCDTGEAKNYYRWTSPQATQQTYSIYVTYQLPATFNGFASDDTVQLTARVDSTSNASVTYEMFKSTGSAVTQCGTSETDVITGGGGSADTWHTYGINGNEATGCSFTSSSAGDFIIFKINLKANSNANAYVSTLSFTTTGR
ncbi:hypothetical protein H6798_02115 [Candidatus Nomurabacteria bacterium]|nr:hypothetical protein [Candidatus Nomurabacteria bacterium]